MTPAEFTSWRERMGFSTEGAARHLGVTERSIYRYEAGERRIPKPVANLALLLAHNKHFAAVIFSHRPALDTAKTHEDRLGAALALKRDLDRRPLGWSPYA